MNNTQQGNDTEAGKNDNPKAGTMPGSQQKDPGGYASVDNIGGGNKDWDSHGSSDNDMGGNNQSHSFSNNDPEMGATAEKG